VHIYIPAVAIPFRIESALPVSEKWVGDRARRTYLFGFAQREMKLWMETRAWVCVAVVNISFIFFAAPLLTGAELQSMNGLVEKKKKAQRCEYHFSCTVGPWTSDLRSQNKPPVFEVGLFEEEDWKLKGAVYANLNLDFSFTMNITFFSFLKHTKY
jgi:hypothetical protein